MSKRMNRPEVLEILSQGGWVKDNLISSAYSDGSEAFLHPVYGNLIWIVVRPSCWTIFLSSRVPNMRRYPKDGVLFCGTSAKTLIDKFSPSIFCYWREKVRIERRKRAAHGKGARP